MCICLKIGCRKLSLSRVNFTGWMLTGSFQFPKSFPSYVLLFYFLSFSICYIPHHSGPMKYTP